MLLRKCSYFYTWENVAGSTAVLKISQPISDKKRDNRRMYKFISKCQKNAVSLFAQSWL